MTNEDVGDRIARLEGRVARLQIALGVCGTAGVIAFAAAFAAIANFRAIVSVEDRTVTVREVRLLHGDQRDGEFREMPAGLTARRLVLGDNRAEHLVLDGEGKQPVYIRTPSGNLSVSSTQGIDLRLVDGDARVELRASDRGGPHLGFLGDGGQMDMGASFFAVVGPAGSVQLEARQKEYHGVLVRGLTEDEQDQFPAR
jgi:hypothetical protein